MSIETDVLLAPLTTFNIGGPARYFCEARTEKEVQDAVAFAREQRLSVRVLGAGSNLLVPDAGIDGLVVHMKLGDIAVHEDGDRMLLIAGAGASWDAIVDAAVERGLHGIENLAGIPGTMGGAVVQNIGAYGTELAPVFVSADVLDRGSGERKHITKEEARFAYRTSIFKEHPELIILRVTLALTKYAPLVLTYADLVRAKEDGVALATPKEVAAAVRAIRARKFPTREEGGTAGSFFKNPVISREHAAKLQSTFPELPTFLQENGKVKVPLAWILDRGLSLKGYAHGPVRLFEKQPLVVVTRDGARASDVNALANEISQRVLDATNIRIEREVETFSA